MVDLPVGMITQVLRHTQKNPSLLAYQADNDLWVMDQEGGYWSIEVPPPEWWNGYRNNELAMSTFIHMIREALKIKELPKGDSNEREQEEA